MKTNELMPWCDCKVAFRFDGHEEVVWTTLWRGNNEGRTKLLPRGWTLDGTDASGARMVVIFRVDGIPKPSDGLKVQRLLERLKTGEVARS